MADAQLQMANTLLKDAEAVCNGTAKLVKTFKPEPGDSAEDIMMGKMHHKALLDAVLLYLKAVYIPEMLVEMGHTQPVSDARLESMAVEMRAKLLVDKLED